MTDLTTITDMLIEKHKERYLADPSDLSPMLITFRDDVPAGIYLSPNFTDPDMKDLTIPMFAEIVKKDNADSYVFTTECWMAPMDEDGLQPSQNPERMEMVIVAAYSKKGSLHRMMKIVRRDDNSVEGLEESTTIGTYSSRFDIYTRETIN